MLFTFGLVPVAHEFANSGPGWVPDPAEIEAPSEAMNRASPFVPPAPATTVTALPSTAPTTKARRQRLACIVGRVSQAGTAIVPLRAGSSEALFDRRGRSGVRRGATGPPRRPCPVRWASHVWAGRR